MDVRIIFKFTENTIFVSPVTKKTMRIVVRNYAKVYETIRKICEVRIYEHRNCFSYTFAHAKNYTKLYDRRMWRLRRIVFSFV